MPPKKGKGTKMTLADFASIVQQESPTTISTSSSWADEDIVLPSAPVGASRDSLRKDGNYNNANGSHQNHSQNSPLPTSPPFRAFIGGISFEAGESEIREELLQGIPLKSLRFPPSRDDHAHRGFCYVEFNTVSDLSRALERNGASINDRPCRIDVSTSDASSSSTFTPTRAPAANMGSWRGTGDQLVGREESQAATSFRARSPIAPPPSNSFNVAPPSKWRNDDSSKVTTSADAAAAASSSTFSESVSSTRPNPSRPAPLDTTIPFRDWRGSAGKVVESCAISAPIANEKKSSFRNESWRDDKKESPKFLPSSREDKKEVSKISTSWRKE